MQDVMHVEGCGILNEEIYFLLYSLIKRHRFAMFWLEEGEWY